MARVPFIVVADRGIVKAYEVRQTPKHGTAARLVMEANCKKRTNVIETKSRIKRARFRQPAVTAMPMPSRNDRRWKQKRTPDYSSR
jgi:hypothetical protein